MHSKKRLSTWLQGALFSSLLLPALAPPAFAQDAEPATPEGTDSGSAELAPTMPDAITPQSPAEEGAPVAPQSGAGGSDSLASDPISPAPVSTVAPPVEEEAETSIVEPVFELRVHIITTTNLYSDMEFEIFNVEDGSVVGKAKGAKEALGQEAPTFSLPPGTYKIVKAGESLDTRIDFATLTIVDDTDYVIVIDPETQAFRGSGVVSGDLPEGVEIAGLRISLNVGGSLWMNHRANTIGGTNGVSALVGVFGNFGMVMDRGPHFLTVDSNLQLNLQDAPTSGVFANTDYLEANALYAYNIKNPYVGPYARAGFKTRVFPGYLYLQNEGADSGEVQVNRLDGSTDTFQFGTEAHADDLRIQLAKPFAPFTLQEEVGANLKAVDLDLKLLKLSVATRIGWAFRQGFTNGLLVAEGEERGSPVVLNEVDDYFTMGPLAGASAQISFARWLFGQAQVAALMPVQNSGDAGANFAEKILIDASGTAGLKFPALTSRLHASFDYTFRLQRDGFLTDKTMFDQIVMARVALQLF